MIVKPHVDWFALAPSLALLAASGLLLMVAVFVPRRGRKPASAFLAFGGFVASGIWAAFLDDRSAHATALVHDAMWRDRWGALAQVILAGAGAVAVLVSYGASYDASSEGRTHQAPEDVAVLAALPGWTIHVPGHRVELERLFASALRGDERVYIRLSDEENHAPVNGGGFVVLREGTADAPLVVAVGPVLGETLQATADLDATVAYLATVRPFPREALRRALRGTDIVLVEPYLAGTSAAEVSAALVDTPHRLLALGVRDAELRRYGEPYEHRAAQGLDARGIRASLERWKAVPGTEGARHQTVL